MALDEATKATGATGLTTDFDQFIKDFFDSPSKTVQAILFFGVGLLVGYLCKRYLKYVFWGLLVTIISIKWLEYQGAVVIDWPLFYSAIGLGQNPNIHDLFIHFFDWVKEHFINVIAGTIGFLIGFRPSSNQKPVNIKIAK